MENNNKNNNLSNANIFKPQLYANMRQRIKVNSVTHVRRTLPTGGKITVQLNQELAPHDSLGKYEMVGGFTSVNIAKNLAISPKDGQKYLQRAVGLKIYQGELLAQKTSIFGNKIIKSPSDGLIDHYDTTLGEVRIKLLSKQQTLTSGVFGIVDQINNSTGEIVIKTVVTEVFGIFGSGRERSGTLVIIGGRDTLLDNSKINVNLNKQIVVTGSLIYGETLKRAAGFGVYGIVSGGLNVHDFKSIAQTIDPKKRIGSDVGISILSTEGFGASPIGEDVFNQIKPYNGRFAFISGNSPKLLLPSLDPDSIISLRKIALPNLINIERQPEVLEREIVIGVKARIIGSSMLGSQGIVIGIDQTPTKLESGISTYMITLDTPSRKIKVPFPNIELIV